MSETLRFSLDFQEKEFVVEHEGKDRKAMLKEMSGREREDYLSQLTRNIDVDGSIGANKDGADQKFKVKSMAGTSTAMLERCCFWVPENPEEKPTRVTKDELLSWPSKVLQKLSKIANEMNAIDEKSKEQAGKNSEKES